ncbi:MAG: sigma-70 family RNA polymerase sigma factor, partial [Isosphaeraceae bacterium]
MASGNHGSVLRDLGRIFDGGSLVGLSDGQLLRRFAAGDEGAFEAIVSRFGPTVLGVCRRLLHDPSDVEDAFQATFLVLLRKAGGLRDADAIGPWLHGVAHRVAARIRVRSTRRPERERRGARPEAVEVDSAGDVERDELRRLIEDEIGRLPEKYRRPVVLCYVEGRTHEEAARRLRCTAGSLRGRLDRARRKLQERLARRGVSLAIGLGALSSLSEAAVPAPLISATIATLSRAATATAAAGSMRAIELADGVFRAMGVVRLKVAAAVMVMAGLVASGAMSMLAAREPARQDAGRSGSPTPANVENVARGRVLDDQGRPIAGARVARGSDLRGVASVPEAVTDAEGRFAMKDIPRGSIVLTAQAPGHAPDLRVVSPGPEISRVEFRLGPGHTIRGRIVDAHGQPIAGAPIAADQWRGHHSLRWSTRTDADGRFRWDEAPADGLLIDLGQLGYDAKRFWMATPDRPEETIAMRRPLRVRGRVTDADTGRPITRFTLVPGDTDSGLEFAAWENNHAREITGLSYDVTLSTVMPARLIRIEAPGYLPAISRVLKDDEEEAVVHFALRRGEGIAGVVRAPDGSPLAGVEIALATDFRPAHIQDGRFVLETALQPRIVRTGADGRFVLEPTKPPYA